MHLAIQALTVASLQACHWNKGNISNKRWKSQLAGGRPVGYTQSVTNDLNSGLPWNKSACGRLEVLNAGPPDYNTSALRCLLMVDSIFRCSYFWQDSCCMWREATSRMCRGYRVRQVRSTCASQGTHVTVSLNIFWAQFLTDSVVILRFSTISRSVMLDLPVRH